MVWSWLVWSSIQTTKSFSTSIVRLFCFLTICLLTGVALLISFKYLFFEFTTWLFVTRGLTFILSWLSTCLSHQALSFIDFDLKWKTQSSSSDEHLEATVGLLTGLISVLFCSRNREAQRVSERWGNGQSVSSNFFAGEGSCYEVDGCWLIRVVAAEGWGGCDNYLNKNEICHTD